MDFILLIKNNCVEFYIGGEGGAEIKIEYLKRI